jgi:prepilin-type N-terminal cleavage/methylation domain-containing protein
MVCKFPEKLKDQSGFSLIEILVALSLVSLVGVSASYYFANHKKLYKIDDQTLQITDVLQEARQRSLTQRETMRVEIDLNENRVRLIDENGITSADDDEVLKTLPIYFPNEVRMDRRPTNIAYDPPEPLPIPSAVFTPSVYPSSATHQVATLRFMSNGTVTNGGNNATGDGAIVTGFSIYVWQPSPENPNESIQARSLTVIGSTGAIRLWEFDPNFPQANKWKDSRRGGSYSGNPQ